MYDNNRAAFFYSYDYNTYGYKGSTRALIYATNAPGYDMEWQIGQDTNLEDDHAHNVALANFRYPSKTRVEVNYIENLTRATIGSSFKQGDSIIVNSINNLNVPKGLQSSGTYIPIGTVTSKMTGASVDYKVTPTGTITASLLGTTDTYTTGKQTNYTPKGTNSITVKKIAGNSDAQDAPVVETNELKKIDDTPQATQGTFTINDLRMATQLQIWAERSMRTGYRYVETILAHFGVHTKDYRLQMAEFLGGFKIPIQISEVVQTAPQTGTSTPMGSMAGHGIGVNHRRIKYGVTEHGFIMGLASVRAHAQYQDGVDRMFFKTNKYEYFWREFSHLTDQAVLNAELYMAGVEEVKAPTSYNNSIFGYQERYGEYKYFYNQVHGLFKTSLSYWHLGRIFADSISTDNTPKLNSDFVSIPSTFMSRLFASSDTSSQILGHFYFDCRVLRPIPKRSHPSLLDHSFGGY
jgi:hypothetical protein